VGFCGSPKKRLQKVSVTKQEMPEEVYSTHALFLLGHLPLSTPSYFVGLSSISAQLHFFFHGLPVRGGDKLVFNADFLSQSCSS
jgi:hypothetical protein